MTSKIKFTEGPWTATINVADFVYRNIVPYEGDASFLMGPSDRTNKLWQECIEALEEERERGGVRSIDAKPFLPSHHTLQGTLTRRMNSLSASRLMNS